METEIAAPFWGFSHPSIGAGGWEVWFKPCWVYVLASGKDERPVKIGVSIDVDRRILQFAAGNPYGLRALHRFPVSVAVALQVERRVHQIFAGQALGREWFDLHADEAAAPIPDLCSKAEEALTAYRDRIESEPELKAAGLEEIRQRQIFERALFMATTRTRSSRARS